MGKTLKMFSYRGISVYVRFLYDRWYELLVSYKGGIYAHQMYVINPTGTEKRVTRKERDEAAITELSLAATALIDNLKKEYNLRKVVKTNIEKVINYGKKATSIFGSKSSDPGVSGRE